jgi:hypothetical protein
MVVIPTGGGESFGDQPTVPPKVKVTVRPLDAPVAVSDQTLPASPGSQRQWIITWPDPSAVPGSSREIVGELNDTCSPGRALVTTPNARR